MRLASNPYLLSVMMALEVIPSGRAQLFEGFLRMLHDRERKARDARHDARSVPDLRDWLARLTRVAEKLQHLVPIDSSGSNTGDTLSMQGVATSLPRENWPAGIAPMLDFSRDASVLQLAGDDLRFTHQLLQEALSSRALREACEDGVPANRFWPAHRWWQRTGWEVVAEIAVESLTSDTAAVQRLIGWLAEANPGLAADIWRQVGEPVLSPAALHATAAQWRPRLTDANAEPSPLARAAIGRWLGALGLDQRTGIGVRADGLPDIDWVRIETPTGFIYQGAQHPALPAFDIARYPVTHRQFQAFIDAGGYADARWWNGLADRFDAPRAAEWREPNAPRETVSWYEAVAFLPLAERRTEPRRPPAHRRAMGTHSQRQRRARIPVGRWLQCRQRQLQRGRVQPDTRRRRPGTHQRRWHLPLDQRGGRVRLGGQCPRVVP